MARITYDTSPEEDGGIAWRLRAENANRAAVEPPEAPLTAAEFLRGQIRQMLEPWARNARQHERTSLLGLYDDAAPEAQAQVRVLLKAPVP